MTGPARQKWPWEHVWRDAITRAAKVAEGVDECPLRGLDPAVVRVVAGHIAATIILALLDPNGIPLPRKPHREPRHQSEAEAEEQHRMIQAQRLKR